MFRGVTYHVGLIYLDVYSNCTISFEHVTHRTFAEQYGHLSGGATNFLFVFNKSHYLKS